MADTQASIGLGRTKRGRGAGWDLLAWEGGRGAFQGPLAWRGRTRGRPGAAGLGLKTGPWSRWPGRVDTGVGAGPGRAVPSPAAALASAAAAPGPQRLTPLPLLQQPGRRAGGLFLELQPAPSSPGRCRGRRGRGAVAQCPHITQPPDRAARVPSPPPTSEQLRLRIQTGPRVTPERATWEDRRHAPRRCL